MKYKQFIFATPLKVLQRSLNTLNWFKNTSFIFLSVSVVIVKSLFDSVLLEDVSYASFIAFGLVFPIIILINLISASLISATLSSFIISGWAKRGSFKADVFIRFSLISFVFGIVLFALLLFLREPIIDIFNAKAYRSEINDFLYSLIMWLPINFMASFIFTVCRVLGLFKSSSFLVVFANIMGAALSYILLFSENSYSPLEAIVVSNSFVSFTIVFFLMINISLTTKISEQKTERKVFLLCLKKGSSVFWSSLLSNFVILLYISILTALISTLDEKVIEIYVYLTRVEQLFLTLYASFINVVIPMLASYKEKKLLIRLSVLSQFTGSVILSLGLVLGGVFLSTWFVIIHLISFSIYESLFLGFFWGIALSLQGYTVFYHQLAITFFSPKLGLILNIFRFVLVGIPCLLIFQFLWGFEGVVVSIFITQAISMVFTMNVWKKIKQNHGYQRI